jgi:hypothetical protein
MTGVNWLDTLLVIVMLIGAGAGAWSFARNRKTYYDIGKDMLKTAWPYLVTLMRPMNPEDQKKLDKSRRLPGEWDNFNKKPRDR